MAINRIDNQSFYEKVSRTNGKRNSQSSDFSESLSGLLGGSTESEPGESKPGETQAAGRNNQFIHTSYRSQSVASTISLGDNGRVHAKAVMECSAKNISYAESDHIKTCLLEGYTFKAQVDVESHKVYIEQKFEDGTVKGYEVNPLEIDKNTEDPLEQMALESWEMSRKVLMGDGFFTELDTEKENVNQKADEKEEEQKLTELSLKEAMEKFYDFIQDRIKNGDQKFQIGGTEMSIKEWDKLLEQIDGDIDAIKKELEERIEKLKEEMQKKAAEKKEEQQETKDAEALPENNSQDVTREQLQKLFL